MLLAVIIFFAVGFSQEGERTQLKEPVVNGLKHIRVQDQITIEFNKREIILKDGKLQETK